MINKSIKNNRKKSKNIVFSVIFIVYMTGIACCFVFLTKNDDNLNFISKLITTPNFEKMENTAILGNMIRCFVFDCIYLFSILVFKYSGILKSLVLTPIFVFPFMKTCNYAVFLSNGFSIIELMLKTIVKDCAIALLLITYCYVTITDIILNKYKIVRDLKVMTAYILGIATVYIINIAVIILI